MSDYRLYLLGADGHIIDAIEFLSTDDEAAEIEARRHRGDRPSELWSGARVVRKYDAPQADS